MPAPVIRNNAFMKEYIKFDQLSVLVIDDIMAMRHALKAQLQSFGVSCINLSSNAEDAIKRIEQMDYDLILCDYNLHKFSSGQHFLEYLRNKKLLKATTIFVMVTAETEYSYVANAVEFTPDDYILKPCSEDKLKKRLEKLIDRRALLMPVLKAINELQIETALKECDKLLPMPGNKWVMDILKRKAELLIELKDYDNATLTYQQALTVRDEAPWALLGLARTCFALGDVQQAGELARLIVKSNPNYVATYELLAEMEALAENDSGVFNTLLLTSKILPSAKRYRDVSEAAFVIGKLDEAKSLQESAIRLAAGSMVESCDDYLSLAQIMVDLKNPEAAIKILEKDAKKYAESGLYGVIKNAILAQAYSDCDDQSKARKLLERSTNLLGGRKSDCTALTALGKANLKLGDMPSGLKLLTYAVQASNAGKDRRPILHVTKAMVDTGHSDKVNDVIDGGNKRILMLVEEARKIVHSADFKAAYHKITEALDIHHENIEALFAAAQLHLLWIRHEGSHDKILIARAKTYLSTLDKLLPQNEKVMGFYRFFRETVGEK